MLVRGDYIVETWIYKVTSCKTPEKLICGRLENSDILRLFSVLGVLFIVATEVFLALLNLSISTKYKAKLSNSNNDVGFNTNQ